MKKVSRYIKIVARIASYSLMGSLEYRVQTVVRIVRVIIETVLTFIFVATFFQSTKQILGWSQYGVLLTDAIFTIIFSLVYLFISGNLLNLDRDIRRGNLDLILTKPLDSQFLISFRHMKVQNVFRIAAGLLIMIYALANIQTQIGIDAFILFIIGFVSGILICYSILLTVATLAFWSFVHAGYNLLETTISTTRYPLDIFPQRVRLMVTIIPIIFVATIPVRTLLGKIDLYTYFAPVVAVLGVLFSRRFLFMALRKYSSASS